jgi:hypothetical protein
MLALALAFALVPAEGFAPGMCVHLVCDQLVFVSHRTSSSARDLTQMAPVDHIRCAWPWPVLSHASMHFLAVCFLHTPCCATYNEECAATLFRGHKHHRTAVFQGAWERNIATRRQDRNLASVGCLRMQARSRGEDISTKKPGPLHSQTRWATKLAEIIGLANSTSQLGWQASMDDSVGARDRDGTWVTRNEEQMEKVFNALNSTIPCAAAFEWLLRSPMPLYVMIEETLGVEIKLIIVPPGQILPPVEHPTGTVVLSKALYGMCDVRQMLGFVPLCPCVLNVLRNALCMCASC